MPKHISISPEWPDWALAEPAPEFLRASSGTASLWLSAESTGPESNDAADTESDHCFYTNYIRYTKQKTPKQTKNKVQNKLKNIKPECFHHESPQGNSPGAHQRCRYAQHIHPQSKSWQLERLAHPKSPGFHTEWQLCSHTCADNREAFQLPINYMLFHSKSTFSLNK